ncbi:MAG: hypothetical protein WBM92_05450 [Aureibaculum sp.]
MNTLDACRTPPVTLTLPLSSRSYSKLPDPPVAVIVTTPSFVVQLGWVVATGVIPSGGKIVMVSVAKHPLASRTVTV